MFKATDYIVAGLLCVFLIRGWRQGLGRALLGPAALLFSMGLSIFIYQKISSLLLSFLSLVFAPFIFYIFFGQWIKFLKKINQKKEKENFSFSPNRLAGSLLNTLWAGTGVLILLIMLTLIPSPKMIVQKIQGDILLSKTYFVLKQLTAQTPLSLTDIQNTASVFNDPVKLKNLQSSPEYQSLMAEEKIQAILADKKTMRQIERNDFLKLLTNPKLQALGEDKEAAKKIFILYQKILQENRPALAGQ